MASVPSQYQSQVNWAAGVIGIPASVVAAQIDAESSFNPNANSSAGAQGIAQFMPGTWSGLGCSGSPYDANSSFKCYAKYMYQLLQEEHGNLRDALAAYNAGPANKAAGYGYADKILAASGQSGTTTGTLDTALSGGGADTCAFGFGLNIPLIGGGACILSKSQARALLGGGTLILAGMILLPGLFILAAYGFKVSGADRALAQSLAALGPYGKAVTAVGAAGSKAGKRVGASGARAVKGGSPSAKSSRGSGKSISSGMPSKSSGQESSE